MKTVIAGAPTRGRLQFVTVATPDFLPAVCVLARSLAEHEPGARLACYLVGELPVAEQAAALPFDVRSTDTLPIPDARRFFFVHTTKELCCALKPRILVDALARASDAAGVVYLDADTCLYAPLEAPLSAALADASVVLSPHLLDRKLPPHVLTIMRAGIYNGGIVTVRNDEEGVEFLAWWGRCIDACCTRDPCGGVSADQRWLDLAVAVFPGVGILRDPGVNVGFWNCHERHLAHAGDRITVNDAHLLRLYHFSNVTRDGLSMFAAGTVGAAGDAVTGGLARRYHDAIVAAAACCPAAREPAWIRFDDGTPILPEHREAVRCGAVTVTDPFSAAAAVRRATPADMSAAFAHRATYWVEHGPGLLADARTRTGLRHVLSQGAVLLRRVLARRRDTGPGRIL